MTAARDPAVRIRAFEAADQAAARAVILEGLGEHFGFIDETLNPDLNDIATSYADGAFLVAVIGGEIAGTGAMMPQPDGTALIVRMSTLAGHRRRGIARQVLAALIERARERACTRIVLGTNSGWGDAIAFYTAFGLSEMRRTAGGVLFELKL
jgi:GNAT superfamily N-acetyltransferase